MNEGDKSRLKRNYTSEPRSGSAWMRLAKPLNLRLANIASLTDAILADLSAETTGVSWWGADPSRRRVLVADQLYACADATGRNLIEGKLGLLDLLEVWSDNERFISRGLSGGRRWNHPQPRSPWEDIFIFREGQHLGSCVRGMAGALDCLGSVIIGVAGLSTPIVAGVDASKVFLAQRALSSAADSAALAAAQGIDTRAVYAGPGIRCGATLPLNLGRSATLAAMSLDDEATDLRTTFADLAAPQTDVAGGDVSVQLSGHVSVPFGRVLGWLDPSYPNGRVPVTETAHATSPVAGGGC